MVVISRPYTRTGDDGTTGLGDFSRTSKTDPRLAAFADVDEANCAVGVAIAIGGLDDDVVAVLRRVQNDLFDVGADLCTPLAREYRTPPLRVEQRWVDELEGDCDRFLEPLPTLRSFVLPGGTPAAAHLHVARTVVRRAERLAWAAVEAHGDGSDGTDGGVSLVAVRYLNRLSDLLFVLARYANLAGEGDVLWQPGGGREEGSQG